MDEPFMMQSNETIWDSLGQCSIIWSVPLQNLCGVGRRRSPVKGLKSFHPTRNISLLALRAIKDLLENIHSCCILHICKHLFCLRGAAWPYSSLLEYTELN